MSFCLSGKKYHGLKQKERYCNCLTTRFSPHYLGILQRISSHAWLWSIALVETCTYSGKSNQAEVSLSKRQGRSSLLLSIATNCLLGKFFPQTILLLKTSNRMHSHMHITHSCVCVCWKEGGGRLYDLSVFLVMFHVNNVLWELE